MPDHSSLPLHCHLVHASYYFTSLMLGFTTLFGTHFHCHFRLLNLSYPATFSSSRETGSLLAMAPLDCRAAAVCEQAARASNGPDPSSTTAPCLAARRHLPDTVWRHLPRLHHELGWTSWRSSTTTGCLILSMNLDTVTSSETYISLAKEMASTGMNYYHPVAARVGRGPLVACRETADFSFSTFLLPCTSSLQPDTIKRSRILPCVEGPHAYLAYFIALVTSLPFALGGLSPLPSKWAPC